MERLKEESPPPTSPTLSAPTSLTLSACTAALTPVLPRKARCDPLFRRRAATRCFVAVR